MATGSKWLSRQPLPWRRYCSYPSCQIQPCAHEGYTHHRSARWPEAVLLRETTLETIVDTFLTTWVARFGVPSVITMDRGVEVTSAKWDGWCSQYVVQHITTMTFHPQAMGWWRDCTARWRTPYVPRAVPPPGGTTCLGLQYAGDQSQPKKESGTSTGEAALGHMIAVPGQLLPLSRRQFVNNRCSCKEQIICCKMK